MAIAAAALLPASLALAQQGEDRAPVPPPNVPAPGEPRAQEQLPEAPPEEVLKSPPPHRQAGGASPPMAAKPEPAPMPNTLPPAKKIEPKVPNT